MNLEIFLFLALTLSQSALAATEPPPDREHECEKSISDRGDLDRLMQLLMKRSGVGAFEGLFPLSPREERINGVSAFYVRGPEGTQFPNKSVTVEKMVSLDHHFKLVVSENGFWVTAESSGQIVVQKKVDIAATDHGIQSLPNSLLASGPSKWIFSVFNFNGGRPQIEVYGISTAAGMPKIRYLFRVWLFGQSLQSMPYVGFGPSIIYKDEEGYLNVYWFDTFGTGDVEQVFKSALPIEGELSSPDISKTGRLTYTLNGQAQAEEIFTPGPDWDEYIRKLETPR